jgi:tRNA threonylcarbamoyladenosine biosynthesis protein TsaE
MEIITTHSFDETFKLGLDFGAKLKGGEVIEFIGDLGAGKTSFVRGLAAGLGSDDEVASPTFTISRIYSGRNGLSLHHFDFYRLSEPGVVAEEIKEATTDPKAIVCVEWAETVRDVLPEGRTVIEIIATDEESREFKFYKSGA